MPSITEYRSPKTLSWLALIPLCGILTISILIILLGFAEIVFPYDVELANGSSGSVWFTIVGLLGFLEIGLRVLAIVFFFVWLFRIFKNLAPTRIRNSEHPPGWAVGFWFIPLINLFKPYQIMQQAWRDTDPDSDPDLGFVTSKNGTNPLIAAWWITFLISNVATRFSTSELVARMSNKNAALVLMIVYAIITAAVFMAISVVREITERQEKRAEKIRAFEALDAPPPPPTFG